MGQHFLIDQSAIERIVQSASIEPGAPVLEIGAGKGILTRAIIGAGASLTALELDATLYEALAADKSVSGRFRLLRLNALRFDYRAGIETPYQIVSNLPYSIATRLIQIFIESKESIAQMTLMIQKELADRLLAEPGSKPYGSLTIFLQYHMSARRLFDLGPDSFRPRPKVDSTVIQIRARDRLALFPSIEEERDFFEFVRASFMMRRKMLARNISDRFSIDRVQVERELSSIGLDRRSRAENLSIDNYVEFYSRVKSLIRADGSDQPCRRRSSR